MTSAKATVRIDMFPPVKSTVDDDDDADNTESISIEESGYSIVILLLTMIRERVNK